MLMILRRLRWRQCIRSTGFVEWISFLSICCHLLILFAWIIFFHFDWEMFFRFVLERCLSMREDINRVLFGYYQCLFVLCVFFFRILGNESPYGIWEEYEWKNHVNGTFTKWFVTCGFIVFFGFPSSMLLYDSDFATNKKKNQNKRISTKTE